MCVPPSHIPTPSQARIVLNYRIDLSRSVLRLCSLRIKRFQKVTHDTLLLIVRYSCQLIDDSRYNKPRQACRFIAIRRWIRYLLFVIDMSYYTYIILCVWCVYIYIYMRVSSTLVIFGEKTISTNEYYTSNHARLRLESGDRLTILLWLYFSNYYYPGILVRFN